MKQTRYFVILGILLLLIGCRLGPSPEEKARQAAEQTAKEWAEIKAMKDTNPDGYYDRLVTFLQNHQDHQEAIAAYVEASMPGIHSYVQRGQYQKAEQELKDLKQVASTDTRLDAWADAMHAMTAVTKEQFDQIVNGMRYDDVVAVMGYPPLPYGLKSEDIEKGNHKYHVVTFIYKNADGGWAAVYFRDGIVYSMKYKTAEESQTPEQNTENSEPEA